MATTRYVSATGSNTAPYGTWATAATSFATVSALVGAGDITYVDSTFAQTGIAAGTITLAGTAAAPAQVISTSDTTNNPPLTKAAGASLSYTTNASVSIAGTFQMYGVTINAGTGTNVANVYLGLTGGNYQEYESCTFGMSTTAAASLFHVTSAGARVKTTNCTLKLHNSANGQIQVLGGWNDIGSTILHTTTQPTAVFGSGSSGGSSIFLEGTDLSDITTALIGDNTTTVTNITLSRCKLASGFTILTGASTGAHAEVTGFQCAFGNVPYAFFHYNYFGNTVAQASIYENEQAGGDGAFYNLAKNPVAWTVTGTNGTIETPYRSPFAWTYTEDATPITPRFEIARDGSTTAYNNDQVWAEFSYLATASVTLSTLDMSSRYALVGANAAQPNSTKVIGNWTGLSATYWLGILQPSAAITPAANGHIGGRICVAGANTVYVNPKILGL